MAQLGARLNGIQKVRGSNPLGSTNKDSELRFRVFLVVSLFSEIFAVFASSGHKNLQAANEMWFYKLFFMPYKALSFCFFS